MKKTTINLLFLLVANLFFQMPISGVGAETSKHPDVQCFLLVDRQKDNSFHKFEMTDRSGEKVTGYISSKPFLSSEHLPQI